MIYTVEVLRYLQLIASMRGIGFFMVLYSASPNQKLENDICVWELSFKLTELILAQRVAGKIYGPKVIF